MKATELRIGNLLQRLDDTIVEVTSTDISIIDSENPFSPKLKPKPIPLTEEWLEKFGFKNQIGFYIEFGRFKDKTLELGYNNDTSETQYYVYVRGLFDNEFVQLRHDLKYVHHLQNLYFSLTGEELILK